MELKNKLTAFLQNITSFFKSPSHNRTLAIVGIIILAAVIPVTVIVLQQQTSTQQHASAISCTSLRGALCLSYQLCRTNYQYCVTSEVYTCPANQVCGYNAGVCRNNGTICSTGGSCCSGYCGSGVCKNPPPPPTDSCPSGSIGCRSTGICSQTNGLTPAGSGFCHIAGQVCCKAYTPPPTPKPINCSTYKFPDGNTGICTGTGSTTHTTCLNANFYAKGPTNCGAGTVCCDSASSPALQNTGIVCGGNHNGACYIYNIVKATSVTCPNGTTTENGGYTTTSDTSGTACGGVHHPIAKTAVSCCVPVAAPNPYAGCNNFTERTGSAPNCQADAGKLAPQCKYPQYYKAKAPIKLGGDWTCVFNKPSGEPPTPSPLPSCSSLHGTCYANHACPANTNEVTASCPSGTYVCCTPKTTTNYCQYATSGDGGYCGIALGHNANTDHLYTCKGNQTTGDTPCANGCQVNSSGSDTCKGSGGGGGGGGNGSCVDPTTKATIAQNHECSNKSICVAGSCVGGCAASGRVCDIPGDTCPAGGGKCVCASGKTTKFAMNITLPGIGTGTFDNHIPKHLARHAAIYVKDSSGKLIVGQTKNFGNSLSHKDGNGPLQIGTFNLKTALACGKTYYVYVKVPGYLTIKQVLTYGSSTQTFAATAVPGDIASAGTDNMITPDGNLAGDDKVTIADYNVVRTCRNVDPNTVISFTSGSTKIKAKCSDLMNYFDYADGGTQGDEWAFNYNLWLRGFLKANGQ